MSTQLTETGSSGRWNRIRERRRLQLLNGAARVFAERGYDHANIRILAEAANVTKATVYAYSTTNAIFSRLWSITGLNCARSRCSVVR
ncbi:helix-turn-helix transcriptional regulator [Stenotrophomonas maltophilia]|uniref:helix-turn-helix domain-containing protein n=1 Tax=Stenotrophomonas sp. TaxID=69392 RepID=UPI002FC91500